MHGDSQAAYLQFQKAAVAERHGPEPFVFLGNLAARTIEASRSAQAPMLALAARVAILVLAGAMALRQMGLANEIITLAFGLLLGAIAVAIALAFGLGCREMAADAVKEWIGQIGDRRPEAAKIEE